MKEFKPLPGEEWRDVVGYSGYYQVSSLGRVRSLPRTVPRSYRGALPIKGRIMKPYDAKGYGRIQLHTEGKGKKKLVHVLVAEAFCHKRSGKTEVNHKDGVISNNAADNLEWVTQLENANHAATVLLRRAGELGCWAKLTTKDVVEIRQACEIKSTNKAALARKYGVSPGVIWHVWKRITWKHVA